MTKTEQVSIRTIERFCLYRRILEKLGQEGREYIFSLELESLTQRKSSQIRRDFMHLPKTANTQKGYKISDLLTDINEILHAKKVQKVVLAGIGNMGRAFINYFKRTMENFEIVAGLDIDPAKTNRVIGGTRIYPLDELDSIVKKNGVSIGIITAPELAAQSIADRFVRSGIRAIINVAPIPLKVPDGVFVENIDFRTSFEKTGYYAQTKSKGDES